ncbi:ATP-dependent DNA helicase DDX31-like [Tubulanus polymorphus]|uniref:ATP-dependent DNA helicase DDX31-like n=1 Tax=Tubulanus polymorphus TaxID=672921 RepID=UPI003DA41AAE
MGDTDNYIQLNITSEGAFTGAERDEKKNSKKRLKSQQARLDRIKKKKKEKQIEDDSLDEQVRRAILHKKQARGGDEKKATKLKTEPSRKRKLESSAITDDNAEKRQKLSSGRGTGIISSLFKNNAEIPKIPQLKVKRIKETVFSANKFSEIDQLHPFMVSNLEAVFGFETMTSVQRNSIPLILDDKDVLIKSQTGSGKTLAYAVPVVNTLQTWQPKIQRSDGTFALVIVPTRELAVQSYETFIKLVKPFTWIVPGAIMGGERKKSEKARIRKGINILVSTPGRLLDHLENTESLNITNLRWLIIDEADRLLDLGFEKEVARIIEELDKRKQRERQTILLSATLNQGVEKLAGMSLTDPARVNISKDPLNESKSENQSTSKEVEGKTDTYSTPTNLKQYFVIVQSKLRLVTLAAFILSKCKFDDKGSKIIVFMATQDSVEFHHDLFATTLNDGCDDDSGVDDDNDDETNNKLNICKLHGEMPQKERTEVFQNFSECKRGVLLTTDVAARGLDLPHVRWIVQYNTPGSPADYVHRVGRTARAGSAGSALLFLAPSEVEYVKTLSDHKISMEEIAVNTILQSLLLHNMKRSNPKSIEDQATALQMTFETYVNSDKDRSQMARLAYLSFIRAYATYPSHLKSIFHVKKLHLGHVAKAFGLREAPNDIGNRAMKQSLRKQKMKDKKTFTNRLPVKKKVNMSEFGSGFDGISKEKKKKRNQKHKK